MIWKREPPLIKPAKGFKYPHVDENSVLWAVFGLLTRWGLKPERHNGGTVTAVSINKNGEETRRKIKLGEDGWGDIICSTPSGRWLEIETKSSTGKLREKQIKRKQYLDSVGAIYIHARSTVDVEERRKEILGE